MAALIIVIVGLVGPVIGFVVGRATARRGAHGVGAARAAATWQVNARGMKNDNVTVVCLEHRTPTQQPGTTTGPDLIVVGAVEDKALDYQEQITALQIEAQGRARVLNAAFDTTPGALS